MRHVSDSHCSPNGAKVEFQLPHGHRRAMSIDLYDREFSPGHVAVSRQTRCAGTDSRQADAARVDPDLIADAPHRLNVRVTAGHHRVARPLPYPSHIAGMRYVINRVWCGMETEQRASIVERYAMRKG